MRPGKRSRTSTQAIAVPMTRLIRATSAEAPMVRVSAAQASGVVTERQKYPGPWSAERQTTAASGIRTIRLR